MQVELPKTAKAAILIEQKKPLLVATIDLPDKLEFGQVLIKFAYSGICGSQIGEIEGVKGKDRFLPHLLGHEGSGEVVGIGPGVSTVSIGDTVVAHWKVSDGIQSETPSYKLNGKKINAGWITTFNEYGVLSENRLTKIISTSSLMESALYGCAITTGFGAVENKANLKLGHSVVVFGSGGIGLNVIQACFFSGASLIYAVDKYNNRLKIAKLCGADMIINSCNSDVWKVLNDQFPDKGPDLFIDNTGDEEIIAKGYNLINQAGTVLLIGVPSQEKTTAINTLPLHFGKRIVGTHGGDIKPETDIGRYIKFAREKKIDFSKIITDVGSLDRINDLIESMKNGKSDGRCMIKF